MHIVIGIKIDYRRSLKAELSLWCPHIVEESGREVFGIKARTTFRGE